MNLPEGYGSTRAPHAWAFAIEAALPWVEEALASGGTLHGRAGSHPERRALTGRGEVFSVPAAAPGPDDRSRWVVRHYFRGGAVARFLDDRYVALGGPRPLREARAAIQARARGIPTPAVVAGAVYPAGAFYRADLVTEEIPDAADLAAVLFDPEPGSRFDGAASLAAAGRLVRTLEQQGIHHRDLNAKNIVLCSTPEGPRAYLVDLDRCQARETGVTAPAYPMRQRLERSLRKFGMRTGRPISRQQWTALRSGWEQAR